MIAPRQFATRFGKTDDCIAILKKWELDVGQRIGWKPGSIRILNGFIGISESEIEFESRFDSLADLEGAWGDMERAHYHREYLKQLEPLIVSGTNRWSLYREVRVVPGND